SRPACAAIRPGRQNASPTFCAVPRAAQVSRGSSLPLCCPSAVSGAASVRSDSLDHLIGSGKERLRNRQAEGFGGLEADDRLDLGWLFNGEVGGLAPPQNFVDEDGGSFPHREIVGRKIDDPASKHIVFHAGHDRDLMLCCQL